MQRPILVQKQFIDVRLHLVQRKFRSLIRFFVISHSQVLKVEVRQLLSLEAKYLLAEVEVSSQCAKCNCELRA